VFDLRENNNIPENYLLDNLSKAYSHIYRAGYDALDWLNISYFKKINDLLKKYHRQDILDAIPTYYSNIQINLINIKKKLLNFVLKKM